MKTFSFYIPSENYTYSFSLESEIRNGITYVDATKLRPPYPIHVTFVLKVSATLSEFNDFQNDVNSFVSYMIQIGGKITRDMLIQAHLMLCWKHINHYGRLLAHDLFTYADLATLMFYAIYQAEMNVYYAFHKQCVQNAQSQFSEYIKTSKYDYD